MATDGVVYSVLWRAPSTKKNKSWENDGYLAVTPSLDGSLRDEKAKLIVRGKVRSFEFVDGDELKLAGKEVKIENSIPYEEYLHKFGGVGAPRALSASSSSAAPRSSSALPPPIHRPAARALLPSSAASSSKSAVKTSALSAKSERPLAFKKFQPLTLRRVDPQETHHEQKRVVAKYEEEHRLKREPSEELGLSPPKKVRKLAKPESDEVSDKEQDPASSSPPPRPVARGEDGVRRKPWEVVEVTLDGEEEDELASPTNSQPRQAGHDVTNHSSRSDQSSSQPYKPTLLSSPLHSSDAEQEREEEVEKREVVYGTHYYLCQWRKQSHKKNITWDGDGVIVVNGRKATLQDRETSKNIAAGASTGFRLAPGDFLNLDSKIVEIESSVSETEYKTGSIFTRGAPTASTSVKSALSASFKLPGLKPLTLAPISAASMFASRPQLDPNAPGAIVMRRPSRDHQAIYNPKRLPVVDVVVDPIIGEQLRPHQIEGVKFMYDCVMGMHHDYGQGCILADDMGLGKTIQAIALMYTLLKQNAYGGNGGTITRVMIVCPVTLIQNWNREIKKWLGANRLSIFVADGKRDIRTFCTVKSYQILLVGYERLRTVVEELKYCQPPIGLIICDEGHRLKSSEAKTTQAFKQLSTLRRIILSGTPLQNNLAELHSMIDFVNAGALDTYAKFKREFEQVIIKSRDPNASAKARKLGSERHDALMAETKKMMLRREASVIQRYLPPKFEFTLFIAPNKLETALYETILKGTAVAEVLSGEGGKTHLSLLTVLRKLSTSPGLLMKQVDKAETEATALTSEVTRLFPKDVDPNSFALSGKLSVLGTFLHGLRQEAKEKVVLVSNFTQTLDIIQNHCERRKYPYCRLDGTTPPADRIALVDKFNRGFLRDHFVFLLSSKSGGTGLNITGASRLVMIDGDWNPSTDAQAMARIHRQGQERTCYIYRFLTAGSLDEKIFQRQITKMGLSRSFMSSQGGGKSGKGNAFTLDDLKSIFKFHPGVSSQTHDLLGCRCHLGEGHAQSEPTSSDDEENNSDEEDVAHQGFLMASQFQEQEPPKDRKKLSLLKEFEHHNTRQKDQVLGIVDDTFLRAVIFNRITKAEESGPLEEDEDGVPVLKGGQVGFVMSLAQEQGEAEKESGEDGQGEEDEEDDEDDEDEE